MDKVRHLMFRKFSLIQRLTGRGSSLSTPPDEGRILVDVEAIDGAFKAVDGIEHPDWDVIGAHVASVYEVEEQEIAWRQICRQWLSRIGRQFGPEYTVEATREVMLLSDQPPRVAAGMAATATDAARRLRVMLSALPLQSESKPIALIRFGRTEDYYTYLAAFYDEGEHPASGGSFLSPGYRHVALPPGDGWAVRSTITHEFTHLLVDSLPNRIPLWLNEGLAQVMPGILYGENTLSLNREQFGRHRRCWSRHGLDGFWYGQAWDETDERFELAYELAEVLVRNLIIDHPSRLVEFIGKASVEDAGQSAAIDCFGESLGDRAVQFLGPRSPAPDGLS